MKYFPTELYLIVHYSSDKARSECYLDSMITYDWADIKKEVFEYPNAAKYMVLKLKEDERDVYVYQNHNRKITIAMDREEDRFIPTYQKYTDFEYLISRQEMIDSLED